MSINDLSFCVHGYTEIKICPSCLREKDDQIASLKSLLRSAHEILEYMADNKSYEGICLSQYNQIEAWLTAYSSLTSSKSGMGE